MGRSDKLNVREWSEDRRVLFGSGGFAKHSRGSDCPSSHLPSGTVMPPRRRHQFTQEHIDQQLQQIHLLDPSSSSENLEQLGPIIKQIHANRQQDAYLRTVQALIDSKDAEIEKICSDNYQDFISSVSTLFTVKSYTESMKDTILSLDTSVAILGGGLVEKKRALLQSKKTAANLDEAIDNLQACLRVLDVVDRVGDMIKEGKYWSALRVGPPVPSHLLLHMFNEYPPFPHLSVARRYPEHATNVSFPNAAVPASLVFVTVSEKSDQGRRDRLHEAVATRDSQRQHRSGEASGRGHGSPDTSLAYSQGERRTSAK